MVAGRKWSLLLPQKKCCRCDDDQSQFFFENGAVVHYYFANGEGNKNIKDALSVHGGTPLDYYDVVFANTGNVPRMTSSSMLDVAEELQAAGVSQTFHSQSWQWLMTTSSFNLCYHRARPYIIYISLQQQQHIPNIQNEKISIYIYIYIL